MADEKEVKQQEPLPFQKRGRGRPRTKDYPKLWARPTSKDPMTGLTERQEKFAHLVAGGMTLTEAGRQAGYDGSPANASRLANKPKVKQRIQEIRSRIVASRDRAAQKDKEASDKGFVNEEITTQWLINEAKRNMQDARMDGKYKDSNDSIKLIAQLTGHLKSISGDKEPNKGDDGAEPTQQVNIQVLNQFTDRLDGRTGDEPKALEATPVRIPESPVRPMRDVGVGEPVEGDYVVVGQDDEPVHVPPAPGSTE